MSEFKIFDKNSDLYRSMIRDIENARRYIYLETFTFDDDDIGVKFKNALYRKAKEGVEIKLLLDDFGSKASRKFFKSLILLGVKVEYFRKFRLHFDFVKKNTSRNHRKSLVIDDIISYIGSSNITKVSINWCESNLRLKSEIAVLFKQAFLQNFDIANRIIFKRRLHTRPLFYKKLMIVRDVPSVRFRNIRKRQIKMIRRAVRNIYIKTPYLLPDIHLLNEIKKAVRRGVEVVFIIPKRSDYRIVDLLRTPYLGILHKAGAKIMLYKPGMMHSKLILVDEGFSIGSDNLDFRSAILQFEMSLLGQDKNIYKSLRNVFDKTLMNCEKFDYGKWKNRSRVKRFLENILDKLKHQL